MLLYIGAHQKIVRTNQQFSKVAVVFFYTNDETSEKEIKKNTPLKIASKTMKYLGIKLTKEVKDV